MKQGSEEGAPEHTQGQILTEYALEDGATNSADELCFPVF